MLDTIKSYLVSLGFSVDKQSYNMATKAMDEAGHTVEKFAGGAVSKFAIAGAAVSSFAITAVLGIAKFLDELGKASIQNEMLARQMWTTEQNAMAFNSTLKAMGVSLQDLYLSPTLMSQFQELRKEANNLQAPADYKNEIQLIQSISFEFKRMKLEATYALQWIGYYFIKYMSGPILQIKLTLSEINDIVIKTMPHWTKVVAQVMVWFAQFGITTVRAIKDVIRIFDSIGDKIPKNMKLIGAAIAALGLVIDTGPIGIIIAILTAAILLLDDFYAYLDGKQSVFGSFWAKLKGTFGTIQGWIDKVKAGIASFMDDLNKNGTLDNFQQTFKNTFDIIKKIMDGAKVWAQDLFTELNKTGVLTDLKDSFEKVLGSASNLDKTVSALIDKLLGLKQTKKDLGDIGDLLNGVIIVALKTINGILESMSAYFDTLSALLGGKLPEYTKKSGENASNRLQASGQNQDKGVWGNLWQGLNEMFTDSFTGQTTFRDRLIQGFSRILTPASYQYPQSSTQHNSTSVNLNQTNNIYGSDPKATADAAQNNMDSMYMRNMRGLIR